MTERDGASRCASTDDKEESASPSAAVELEFATQRAFPGGVRVGDRKLRRDFLEELADAINYGVWEVCYDLQPRADAGDSVAGSRIPSRLGAIRKLTEAWDMLHLP